MASNFRISTHRSSESLHLKLVGDFDGSSAFELINVLKKNWNGAYRVFIHTDSLKDINPITFFSNDTLRVFAVIISSLREMPFHHNANNPAPEGLDQGQHFGRGAIRSRTFSVISMDGSNSKVLHYYNYGAKGICNMMHGDQVPTLLSMAL